MKTEIYYLEQLDSNGTQIQVVQDVIDGQIQKAKLVVTNNLFVSLNESIYSYFWKALNKYLPHVLYDEAYKLKDIYYKGAVHAIDTLFSLRDTNQITKDNLVKEMEAFVPEIIIEYYPRTRKGTQKYKKLVSLIENSFLDGLDLFMNTQTKRKVQSVPKAN